MTDRYSSVKVMITGIVLGTAGAIIAYALTIANRDIDVHTLGVIVLGVGVAVFAVGIAAAIVSVLRDPSRYDSAEGAPPDRY